VAEAVRFHDDQSTYTGIHQNGGEAIADDDSVPHTLVSDSQATSPPTPVSTRTAVRPPVLHDFWYSTSSKAEDSAPARTHEEAPPSRLFWRDRGAMS
jgi:hypothetical protein